jgi:N-acetylneuraminic acid mutarotase
MNRRSAVLSLALCLATLSSLALSAPANATAGGRTSTALDLNARVAAQRAIESTYWTYRDWPSQNPGAKPVLDKVVSLSVMRDKVEATLRLTNALRTYWNHSVSGAELQAEVDRQAKDTRQPQMLNDLWAALGNDPNLIAETLGRSTLVDRLARSFQASDPRFSGQSFESWWAKVGPSQSTLITAPGYDYRLPSLSAAQLGTWSPTHALPEADVLTSAVWTGAEMIIWGGTEAGGSKFNSGSRYDPATDTWHSTSGVNAPAPRKQHSAVWTGTEMIVWGGCGLGDEHNCQINTGGRYNPVTDTWATTTTIGAPAARINSTAVWTGTDMIVWGGCSFSNDVCTPTALGNGGGRYDPVANSWQPTSTTGAPEARQDHTAVWSGSEMIVWGGIGATVYANGARYDPVANTWTPTAAVPSTLARYNHTAVWAGTQMTMWGGTNGTTYFNTGARYFPLQNRWQSVSRTNAPSARAKHTAVWTGTEMVVWGGCSGGGVLCSASTNTGGRYNPSTNAWIATSTTSAPSARNDHVAVWSGSVMIVWGSGRTGGRYDPATDTWTPTNANEAASAREWHTATWTGAEMVVWGGDDRFFGTVNTGGRYDLATDSWQPTATIGAPSARILHTAIWTGTEVIVWGGQNGSTGFKTGGRYNPVTNAWTATTTTGAPEARSSHSAVWTGTEMIVWGGSGNSSPWIKTGGRYNPTTNTWTPTSLTGAPVARSLHTAVWTGSQMVVWGGATATFDTNTGGRYNPATNTWTPSSTVGAPDARNAAAGVWTGSKVLVWGGSTYDGSYKVHQTGAIYDPVADTWTPTSLTNAPSAREFFAYAWTGNTFIVWGGCTVDPTCVTSTYTGGQYTPSTDTWIATELTGAPNARGKTQGVWTGNELIVWGGETNDSSTFTNTGGRYAPATI